jgi:hypothetical protein
MDENRTVETAVSPAVVVATAGAPGDAEIRRRVIDRVIDVGGEVLDARVDHGAVWVRGRVGEPGQVTLAQRLMRQIDGVMSVDAVFVVCGAGRDRPLDRV